MPPEPPHTPTDDDTANEDQAHQAELEGYQLLTSVGPSGAYAAAASSDTSASESSSDEDEDVSAAEPVHRVSMTIQWPAEEEQVSEGADSPQPEFEHCSHSTAAHCSVAAGSGEAAPAPARAPASARTPMSSDEASAVRRAMRGVQLPAQAVPEWARGLTDQQCQQVVSRRVERLAGSSR